MKLKDLVCWLDQLLAIGDIEDISLNGLQVGDENATVSKVAYAVDAGMDVFVRAVEEKADVLFVHHGLFWGNPLAIRGAHYERIRYLMDHKLALYACHLPLDKHLVVGNNAGIAKRLGLKKVEPFGEYHGHKIGVKGALAKPLAMAEVLAKLNWSAQCVKTFHFHNRPIKTVGIVSGDAPNEIRQAIAQGLDLYITGESSHALYHECKEAKMNAIFGGHYQTELFGPTLVGQKMAKELGLETVFVDIPTGL